MADAFASQQNGEGFQMAFANGWTVSVMWGAGNYSSNRGKVINPVTPLTTSARTAEVAARHDDHGDGHFDDVRGWLTPEDVAAYIAEVAARA